MTDKQQLSDSEKERVIFAEKTRLLYNGQPSSLLTVLFLGLILAIVQWPVIAHQKIIIWFLIVVIISGARLWLFLAFRKNAPANSAIRPWATRFFFGTLFSGLSWGLASWMLFPPDDIVHQAFLALSIAGIIAGAVTTLSAMLPVTLAFLLPVFLPLIERYFAAGTATHLAMGTMMIIFLTMMLLSARRSNTVVNDSLNLRFSQRKTQAQLDESAELNQLILESAAEGIFGVNKQAIITFVNPSAASMLGYEADELIGKPMHSTIHHSHSDGSPYPEHQCPTYTTISKGESLHIDDETLYRKDGSCFSVDYNSNPILKNGVVQGAVVSFGDITEHKIAVAKIEYQAFYDDLTGLPNRRLLLNRMQQVLAHSKRRNSWGALLFFDLDHFKSINDSLGHAIGDKVLKIVASRLASELRREDTVARLSGDEFVILLTEVGDDEKSARDVALAFAEKNRIGLSRTYQLEDHLLHITSSIGITMFPMDNSEPESLLREADIAMYRAKKQGRDSTQFYLPSMQMATKERLLLENDLRLALAKKQMKLRYQPVVDAEGKLTGAEVLLRWQHPTRGLLTPKDFISLAEDSSLILSIGEWVLNKACRQIKEWHSQGIDYSHLFLAINICPLQFKQEDFVRKVQLNLDQSKIEPTCIVLEVTENIVIADVENAIQKMHELRDIGVALAIDDFGTGYSSLNYLRRLPLDKLKIDQSFIRNVASSKKDAAIVEAIVSLAHNLGLDVIAEGIEKEEELNLLQAMGCNNYQGYLFHYPLTLNSYQKLLTKGSF